MIKIWMFLTSVCFASTAGADLRVHEWGTFTSLVGSNGVAQHGMYYEDESLPDFVHNFGEEKNSSRIRTFVPWAALPPGVEEPSPPTCPGHPKVGCRFLLGQKITQKMETPVVYFYADRPQKVEFTVEFPRGIISQSYPAPTLSLPEPTPGVELKNGLAKYEVTIRKDNQDAPPFVEPSNIYSHARNVASDLVQVGDEVEKFIFYRGLGEFNTQLLITSKNGTLQVNNSGQKNVPAIFLIYTGLNQDGNILNIGELQAKGVKTLAAETITQLQRQTAPHSLFVARARSALFDSLTQAGLFADEATSMIDTWENGYFKTPGLRILYVLNRQEVEEILPIKVSPTPEFLNRVFVGRVEVLLDTFEDKILAEILAQKTRFEVTKLGHLAYPTLLRTRQLAHERGLLNPETSAVFNQLILSLP